MAKQSRAARTNAPADGGRSTFTPSVQGQVLRRSSSAPNVNYPGAESVLGPRAVRMDDISGHFARFFGQVSAAADSVRNAINIGERKRIEQENKAQQAQATADFYAGKDMAEPGDADYYDTYQSLLAARTAYEAAEDFDKWYREDFMVTDPMGDLSAARDAYIEEHLVGKASDPMFEAQVLAGFVKGTEQLVADHRETAVRIQVQLGKENLTATINADAKNGALTADRIPFYIQSYKTLDPLNPDLAPAKVAEAIQTAIVNNPSQIPAILDVLTKKGTGRGDQSFAQSFPDAYANIQNTAVTEQTTLGSVEELAARNALLERTRKISEMSPEELTAFPAEVLKVQQQYGMPVNDILDGIQTEVERRAAAEVETDALDRMKSGQDPIEPALVRKNFMTIAQESGAMVDADGNPITNYLLTGRPDLLANAIVQYGTVVDDGFKTTVSGAMLDFSNPNNMQQAIKIVDALASASTPEQARSTLTTQGALAYDYIRSALEVSPNGIEWVAKRLEEGRRKFGDKLPQWPDYIKGKTPEEAKKLVDDTINGQVSYLLGESSIFGAWHGDVYVDATTRESIKTYGLLDMTMRDAEGWDWKTSLGMSVQEVVRRADVLPGMDGRYVMSVDTDRPTTWVDLDGDRHDRVRLGFAVPNPNTGKEVNTVEVYEKDVRSLGALFPVLFDDGSEDGVTLYDDARASAAGGYAMKHDGDPMVYELGRDYEVLVPSTEKSDPFGSGRIRGPYEKKTIHVETVDDLYAAFDLMPDGFFFYEDVIDGKPVYGLGYRPNFGPNAGKSIDEREAEFNSNGD